MQKIQNGYLILGLEVPYFIQNAMLSSRTPEIENVYNDIVRLGKILFKIDPGNMTPKETINLIISKCPVIKTSSEELLGDYQDCVYGGKESDDQKARELGRIIQLSMLRYKVSTWTRFMRSLRKG
jgi:hypothetical protein